jgi:uncharacterized membrane protein YgcG
MSKEITEKFGKRLRHVKKGQVRDILSRFVLTPSQPISDAEHTILCSALQQYKAAHWKQNELLIEALGHCPQTPEQKRSGTETITKVMAIDSFPDFGRLVLLWSGCVTVLCSIWAKYSFPEMPLFAVLLIYGIVLPFTYLVACVWADLTLNNLRVTAVGTLRLLGIPETVMPLARATHNISYNRSSFTQRVRTAARPALLQALSTLTSEHYLRLSPDLVPSLCIVLQKSEEGLSLEILHALEKMGDGRAVSVVERLTKKGKTPAVRSAAERLLPILQQRQLGEQAHSTLLRASHEPNDAPNMLLRPSQPHFDMPDYLLRVPDLVLDTPLDFDTPAPDFDAEQSAFLERAGGGIEIVDIAEIAAHSLAETGTPGLEASAFDTSSFSSGTTDSSSFSSGVDTSSGFSGGFDSGGGGGFDSGGGGA